MRPILVLILATTTASAIAASALAQTADRYGGYGAYQSSGAMQQGAPAAPARVLSWPGKAVPAAAPPQAAGYAYPRYMQAQPAYGSQLQPAPYAQRRGAPPTPYQMERRATMYPAPAQAAYYPPAPQGYAPQGYAPQPYPQQQMAPQQQPQMRPAASYPSPYQAQPYYAPAPGAPAPAPGSTATAPTGVYPANTVPPQLAYPMAVPPQMAAPLVGPQAQQQLPTSIYASPQGSGPQASAPQAGPMELNGSTGLSGQGRPNTTDPRKEQRVAMNTAAPPVQSARLYSLHREFGMTPDPTPAPTPQGPTVELVSSIDSGGAPNPDADAADRPATRKITDSTGKTVTAQLRGAASASVN